LCLARHLRKANISKGLKTAPNAARKVIFFIGLSFAPMPRTSKRAVARGPHDPQGLVSGTTSSWSRPASDPRCPGPEGPYSPPHLSSLSRRFQYHCGLSAYSAISCLRPSPLTFTAVLILTRDKTKVVSNRLFGQGIFFGKKPRVFPNEASASFHFFVFFRRNARKSGDAQNLICFCG